MISTRISLVSLFAALLLLSLQAAGHATLQYARTNSTFSIDGLTALTVSATVYKNLSTNSATPPQLSGSIMIAGHTGPLNLTLSALPSSVTFSTWTAANNVVYKHAVVITQTFSYLNLITGLRTPCWMELDLTKGSDGSQTEGFKIYQAANNTLLVETERLSAPGRYCELPAASGSILLHF